MNFSGKNIIIKNAQAELETGDVNLSGTIGRTAPRKINLKARVKLDNQPIDKLISDTGFGDKGVKGTLSVKSSLNLEGNADDGILKTLSGNIDNMVITKGLLKNSRVFIKILAALNIPAKFKERPPEMREEGFYFESLEGTAVIKKGILKTDGFVLKSPAFNAVGSGEENLYKQTHRSLQCRYPAGVRPYHLLTTVRYREHAILYINPESRFYRRRSQAPFVF